MRIAKRIANLTAVVVFLEVLSAGVVAAQADGLLVHPVSISRTWVDGDDTVATNYPSMTDVSGDSDRVDSREQTLAKEGVSSSCGLSCDAYGAEDCDGCSADGSINGWLARDPFTLPQPPMLQRVGINTGGWGADLFHFHSTSGNVTDDTTHRETWDILRQLVGRPDFLYVADCKLATRDNLQYIHNQGGQFVAILPRTRREDSEFRRRLVVDLDVYEWDHL